jgi:hypothetical protein
VGFGVELFAVIKRDAGGGGLSIRQLVDQHRVHRRTMRQASASAILPPRKTPTQTAPWLDGFRAVIDAMLHANLHAPCKQPHTARRYWSAW